MDKLKSSTTNFKPCFMSEIEEVAKKYNCTLITNEMAKTALEALELVTRIRREVTEVPDRGIYTDENGYLIGSLVLRSDILRIIDKALTSKEEEERIEKR